MGAWPGLDGRDPSTWIFTDGSLGSGAGARRIGEVCVCVIIDWSLIGDGGRDIAGADDMLGSEGGEWWDGCGCGAGLLTPVPLG